MDLKKDELKKFKDIFNDIDFRDNPLNKLNSKWRDPSAIIIISIIILAAALFFPIIIPENTELIPKILYSIFIILIILFFVCGIFIISFLFGKYHIINIYIDLRIKKVLDMYNKRIIYNQSVPIINLFFNLISIAFTFISFCNMKNQKYNKLNNDEPINNIIGEKDKSNENSKLLQIIKFWLEKIIFL